MKKMILASALMMTSSLTLAQQLAPDQKCYINGGIFVQGVCIESSVSAQVAGFLANEHRRAGGNEKSVGDNVVEAELKVSKDLPNRRFKAIYIDISAVPSTQVLNYQEKNDQNYHNQNRLRADGYVDRPWLIANIGADIELSENQDLTLLAGSFEANGLHPLNGKPSKYYMTAPYGIFVRYDKGIQANYELKDELDRILLASFSVIDGDTPKGESDIDPDDSRANSYPSGSGTVELQISNALGRAFEKLGGHLKNHDLYMGVTGSIGDAGSYVGEKRRQNDTTAYMGYLLKTKKGEGEVRVFKSNYVRNPIGDGSGNHIDPVVSSAHGVEVAFRGIETKNCDWELYGNKHYFNNSSEKVDGEFTWGNTRTIEGWTVGASCKNFRNVNNLDFGVEYGEVNTFDAQDKAISKSGMQIGLVVSYKLGMPKKKKKL